MEITIGIPVKKEMGSCCRMETTVLCDGIKRTVWFEVENEFAEYLVDDRCDACLIGMLNWAMRNGYDVRCEGPVSEDLLYQLREYLIPSLSKYANSMHASAIVADKISQPVLNAGAVGTGMSCGVDSLHVLSKQNRAGLSDFNLTHLTLFNVGAYREGSPQFKWQIGRAAEIAKLTGLNLVVTNSNLSDVFPRDHHLQHTFSNAFGIHALGRLWKTYFYGSSGMDFSNFSLVDNDIHDAAYYELLSIPCFSTKSLRIYSEGAVETKFEKTRDILDYQIAQKFLHVCVADNGANCNVCSKCRRQLLMLDALDGLDKFKDVFDIEYYQRNRAWYYRWLVWNYYRKLELLDQVYPLLRGRPGMSRAKVEAFALYPLKFMIDKLCRRA